MNLILSFPRSGNHFVRYIVEFGTGKATQGHGNANLTFDPNQDSPICCRTGVKFLSHVSKDHIIAKKEHFYSRMENNNAVERVVLILRDPRETFLSFDSSILHSFCSGNLSSDIKRKIENYSELFIENLNFYESFEGPKEIVLYEDLISDRYTSSLESLNIIFNFDQSRLVSLTKDFEKYKMDSIKSPNRKPISADKSSNDFYIENIKSKNINNFNICQSIFEDVLNHKIIKEYYA